MLSKLLSHYASRIKGGKYTLDDRIPPAYLVRVMRERGLMKIRGMLAFPRRKHRPFIGDHVTIKAKGKLTLGPGVTFGPGSYVDALSTEGVHLGSNVSIGRNTRLECTGNLQTLGIGISVGNNVGLGTDCFYGSAGGISIGDDTVIGNLVTCHSENHSFVDADTPIRLQGVTHSGIVIGSNCWIGAKATILDGAVIGDGCVIAAASVVTAGKYTPNGIYAGTPAKLIKSRLE